MYADCFLESAATILSLMRDQPPLAEKWIEQERTKAGKNRSPSVAMFRKDRPNYTAMLQAGADQQQPGFRRTRRPRRMFLP